MARQASSALTLKLMPFFMQHLKFSSFPFCFDGFLHDKFMFFNSHNLVHCEFGLNLGMYISPCIASGTSLLGSFDSSISKLNDTRNLGMHLHLSSFGAMQQYESLLGSSIGQFSSSTVLHFLHFRPSLAHIQSHASLGAVMRLTPFLTTSLFTCITNRPLPAGHLRGGAVDCVVGGFAVVASLAAGDVFSAVNANLFFP